MIRKHHFLAIAVLSIVVLALPVAAWAQEGDPTIQNISLPDEVYKGDAINIAFSLEGGDPGVEYRVLFCAVERGEQVEAAGIEAALLDQGACPNGTLSESSLTGENSVQSGSRVQGTLTAPVEGQYVLGICVFEIGEEGDGAGQAAAARDFTVTSPLPDSVARLLAGLGVFAAMMAVMAAGTEVVIDSFKGLFGFKRKVTAMEAFESLQAELPGRLKALGVEQGKVLEFQKFTEKFRSDLENFSDQLDWKTLFETYLSWEKVLTIPPFDQPGANLFGDLEQGLLGAGFQSQEADALVARLKKSSIFDFSADKIDKTLDEILSELSSTAGQGLKQQLETVVSGKLNPWLQNNLLASKERCEALVCASIEPVKARMPFFSAQLANLEQMIVTTIEKWELKAITLESIEKIFKEVMLFLTNTTAAQAGDWVEEQLDVFTEKGRKNLDEALGFLQDLGLPEIVVTALTDELKEVETKVDLEAQTFIVSTRKLLEGVEKRRNEIQSPIRNFWRWMRDTSKWSLWMALFAIALLSSVWVPWKPIKVDWWPREPLFYWWVVIGVGLLVVVVCLVLNFSNTGTILKARKPGDGSRPRLRFGRQDVTYWGRYLYLLLGITLTMVVPFKYPEGRVLADQIVWLKAGYTFGVLLLLGWLDYSIDWGEIRFGELVGTFEAWIQLFIRGQGEGISEIKATLGKPDQNLSTSIQKITQTTLASTLLKLENAHVDQEKTRQRWMRVMALVVGSVLAYLLRIDALDILKEAFPTLDVSFNQELDWSIFNRLYDAFKYYPTPGMLLTGLAASAGSKFWHDLLGRLEATKKSTEDVAKTVQSIKRSMPGVGDQ